MRSERNSKNGITEGLGERPFKILLAEDDEELRRLLSWCLRTEGYDVTECTNGIDLLGHLRRFLLSKEESPFRLIVSDIRMPGVTSLEVLESAGAMECFPPLILITPFGDEELGEQAARLGAIPFLDEPFEIEKLVEKVREVAPITILVSEGA